MEMEMEMEMSNISRDWSHLPPAVLRVITHKLLPYIADLAIFLSVCPSWRFAATEAQLKHVHVQLPWLLLPYPLSYSDLTTRRFFSLAPLSSSSSSSSSGPTNCHLGALNLGMLFDKVYCGTQGGRWLLAVGSGLRTPPFLLNPFDQSQQRLSLPPLPPPTLWQDHHPYEYYLPNYEDTTPLCKIVDHNDNANLDVGSYTPSVHLVATSPPGAGPVEVMAVHAWDQSLSFCRVGDEAWTPVLNRDTGEWQKGITCLAHSHGRFYAVDVGENLLVCDTRASPPYAAVAVGKTDRRFGVHYLAGSESELFLVYRRLGYRGGWEMSCVVTFEVYRLEVVTVGGGGGGGGGETMSSELVKTNDIGDRAIFIGDQNSVVVSTDGLDFGCERNSVYYCNIFVETGDLSRTEVKLLEYCIGNGRHSRTIDCSPPSLLPLGYPVWIQPGIIRHRRSAP